MKSFDQLLNHHIRQLGISDTELARAVGVSRQTIFRWREGLTSRPRRREDVLAIAGKLRLTTEERDALLLAAGFRPEETVPVAEELPAPVPEDKGPEPETDDLKGEVRSHFNWRSITLAVASALLVVVLILWWVNDRRSDTLPDDQDRVTVTAGSAFDPTITMTIPPASSGEILVIVASQPDSASGSRFAAQLHSALQREVNGHRLTDVRLAVWPQAVGNREDALRLGAAARASLVILGELNPDQVVAQFVHRPDHGAPGQNDDAWDVSIAIKDDRPLQLRALALVALGQLTIRGDDLGGALALLAPAANALQDDGEGTDQAWLLVNGLLCHTYALEGQPEQALSYCQQAIEVAQPSAFLASRGLAHGLLGEASLAIADFQEVAACLERESGQLARTRSWSASLQAGEDPFTPALLNELRADFVRSGFAGYDSTCMGQAP
jgi:transcriptional regulator with XRE-family HTH domain